MFKQKSADELKAMNADQLQAYYIEKANHENEALQQRIASLEAEKNSEKYASLENEIKALKESKLNSLEQALKMQGVVLEKLRNGSLSASTVMEVEGSVSHALKANRENFVLTKKQRHPFTFSIKAASDMTFSGHVTGTMPQAQRLPGVNNLAERKVITYDLIPKLNTEKNTIEWVYETAQDGTISGTSEGAAKPQIDNDFVVTSVALVKRPAYFKVSTEMLDDEAFMEGWFRNKLLVRLLLDVDNQCLNGNNSAPNLNGVLNQSTAFSAGTFATLVDNANEVDVLAVAMNQIKIADQVVGNLVIIMHPSDVTALKLVKLSTTDKRYVDRLQMAAGSLSVDGVPIIENRNITAGTYLVGDMSKAVIVQKQDISIEVGLDGNDFTKNMRTILAEWRGQLFIQNNDRTAFVKGTFSTDKAALETP